MNNHMPPPPFFGREGFEPKTHRPHSGRKERKLSDISVTVWLTPDNTSFCYRDGFLYLTMDGKEQRVSLYRAFPFEKKWEFISAMGEEEVELGLIRDLNIFPEETKKLLMDEIGRRYFSPTILSIQSIKERYGFFNWKVQTEEGPTNITIRDPFRNILNINGVTILIIDVDGNRYEIADVMKLDKKSYKKIEIYL